MEHKSDHYTGAAAPLLVDQTAGFGLAGLLISGLPFLAPFSPQAWAPAAKQRERAKTKAILRIMVVVPSSLKPATRLARGANENVRAIRYRIVVVAIQSAGKPCRLGLTSFPSFIAFTYLLDR